MSQSSTERILSENPVRQSTWIGAEAQMFQRVGQVFALCGYRAPLPDVPDGTGAYVRNIADQYTRSGDLTSEQVTALLQYARAHQLAELQHMEALDVDTVVLEVLRWGEPYTAPQVATQLHLSEDRVRRLASALHIGRKHGRDWLFSAADVAVLRARNTQRGRPFGYSPTRNR